MIVFCEYKEWEFIKKWTNLTFKINFLCQESFESFWLFSIKNNSLVIHFLLKLILNNLNISNISSPKTMQDFWRNIVLILIFRTHHRRNSKTELMLLLNRPYLSWPFILCFMQSFVFENLSRASYFWGVV